MEVKICRNCKKMFQYITGPVLCPRCKQIEEELFLKVKEFLRENPGATLYEVTKVTGVSAALIEKFLRQGRLQVAIDSPITLNCERCGKKVVTGKYCNECKKEITDELTGAKNSIVAQEQAKNDQHAKMRFLQSDKVSHQ
ncbi:MAG: hypothetical protein J6F30_17645 [Cellulosilyticum sp.]|nr:hypothetical protein [Cellulosilyticum sp.]